MPRAAPQFRLIPKAETEKGWHSRTAQAGRHLYASTRWKRLRLAILAEEPLCRMCNSQGFVTPATDVDHITPHNGDETAFFEGPFQALCKSCHSRKTRNEMDGKA